MNWAPRISRVVEALVADGHCHHHLIAVDKMQRYTGDVSRATGFRGKCRDREQSKSRSPNPGT